MVISGNIYTFESESFQEARELTKNDLAIEAGSLFMELKEVYGSAGLMAVNKTRILASRKAVNKVV